MREGVPTPGISFSSETRVYCVSQKKNVDFRAFYAIKRSRIRGTLFGVKLRYIKPKCKKRGRNKKRTVRLFVTTGLFISAEISNE